MLHRRLRPTIPCLLALVACAGPSPIPPTFARLLADTPENRPARLWLAGDRLVGATVDLGPGALPPAVRTTLDAVEPRGEVTFQGREWGPRGEGYRIDKIYRDGTTDHLRSALIADDGAVLERSHSVPLAEVPQDILAAALQTAPQVEQVFIVSGRERQEAWSCTVTDRLRRTYVVTIGLDGRTIGAVRRVQARIDV